jgi:hypothetical protein
MLNVPACLLLLFIIAFKTLESSLGILITTTTVVVVVVVVVIIIIIIIIIIIMLSRTYPPWPDHICYNPEIRLIGVLYFFVLTVDT